MDKEKLIDRIYFLVQEEDFTFFDAIVEIMNSDEIEIEDMAKFVRKNKTIKNEIEKECSELGMMKEFVKLFEMGDLF